MTTGFAGIDEFETMFHDLETAVSDADYTTTLEECQQDLAEQHAGMFAGEFDSNLNDWATLKPSTIKSKGHDRILVESGALMASLTSVGGPGNIHEVMPRGMLFGTEVEYAHFHQTGTKKMPARPPVGMSEETLDKLCDKIADATVEKLRE
jgi:phage gpG-like protein